MTGHKSNGKTSLDKREAFFFGCADHITDEIVKRGNAGFNLRSEVKAWLSGFHVRFNKWRPKAIPPARPIKPLKLTIVSKAEYEKAKREYPFKSSEYKKQKEAEYKQFLEGQARDLLKIYYSPRFVEVSDVSDYLEYVGHGKV